VLNFKKHLPLLVVIGSCILVFAFLNDKEDYVDEYNTKIKALEAKVDSLHSENEGLNNNILELNLQITNLDKEIDLQDNKIYTLNIKTNEKVSSVDLFNDDELEQFFTDRYRHVIDSITKANSEASN
jgi:peptidoglycan hydrolase CwlO-like protein